jgi:hypothetical protein
MEFSDVLATIALIVSMGSAWLSYRAHRESTEFTEREARREFSRERSEFLIRIERSTKLFERAQARIEAILARIESESASAQSSVDEMVQQLKSDLEHLQGCLRQSRSLWDENFDMSHDGFAHHKPRHLALLEDDDRFAQEAMRRADRAEESLGLSNFLGNPVIG